ncbi:MAG: tripartite tricarboxylate transporter substrate binding protein [Betaproteobacteria bacterium]
MVSPEASRACALILLSVMLALSCAIAPSASAQDWPIRPVRLVVGQTPGAPVDLIARIVAEQLTELWQQPVVVENRGGAGSTIAAEHVAKAPADGYTLLLGGQSNLAAVASLETPRNYDPVVDFFPVGRIVHVPYFIVVNAAVPARTIPEFIAEARARPGRITFVSFGEGTFSSIAYRQLMSAAQIDLLEIPYKGASQAMTDLVAGRVDTSLAPLSLVKQHAATGSLRVIAALGAKRASVAPQIATVAEQGVAGVVVETWYGLAAPAGVSADVRAQLVEALSRIRRSPVMRKKLEDLEYEPMFDDPAQFAAAIRADIETFTRAMKRAQPPAGR